jgi:glycine/D-amino acid oxidase-like deaminating enzyme
MRPDASSRPPAATRSPHARSAARRQKERFGLKTIIIGGGIMGLCSAWALRRAGHEVVLYEQGPIPNPLGSSCDQHRLIRYTYGDMAGYARMVALAYPAWQRLWDDLGRSHYRETGTLAIARERDDWVRQSRQGLADLGVPFEIWQPDEIATHLPFLQLGSPRYALYTPSGGVLFAELILRDLADHLRTRGVDVQTAAPVRELDPVRATVWLADGRQESADLLIVATGPWTARLLPTMATRITPSRQVAAYLEPPSEQIEAWRRAPAVLDQVEAATGGFYALPPVDGTALKVGDHGFSRRGQPDREREPTAEDLAAALAVARTRFVDFERYRVQGARTCFYSVAEGERFIVEPIERAWVLAGFSGHGFKFGTVIGEMLAQTLAGARAAVDLSDWAAGEA